MVIRQLLGCMVIGSAALIPIVSNAGEINGTMLLQYSQAADRADKVNPNKTIAGDNDLQNDLQAAMFWWGFVSAASILVDDQKYVCVPTSNSLQSVQFSLILKKFMATHPEQLHNPAALVAKFAAMEAFPCPKK